MSEKQQPKRTRSRTPNNRTTTGFRIFDDLWKVLEPVLPVRVNTHRFGGGRPQGSRMKLQGKARVSKVQ